MFFRDVSLILAGKGLKDIYKYLMEFSCPHLHCPENFSALRNTAENIFSPPPLLHQPGESKKSLGVWRAVE